MTSHVLRIQQLLTLVQSCCSYNVHLLSFIHLRIPYTELLRNISNVCISFKLEVRSRGLSRFWFIYFVRLSQGSSVHSYSASRTIMSGPLSAMLILISIQDSLTHLLQFFISFFLKKNQFQQPLTISQSHNSIRENDILMTSHWLRIGYMYTCQNNGIPWIGDSSVFSQESFLFLSFGILLYFCLFGGL